MMTLLKDVWACFQSMLNAYTNSPPSPPPGLNPESQGPAPPERRGSDLQPNLHLILYTLLILISNSLPYTSLACIPA